MGRRSGCLKTVVGLQGQGAVTVIGQQQTHVVESGLVSCGELV